MTGEKTIVVRKKKLSAEQLSDIRAARSRAAQKRIATRDYGLKPTRVDKIGIALLVLFFIALKIGLKLYRQAN